MCIEVLASVLIKTTSSTHCAVDIQDRRELYGVVRNGSDKVRYESMGRRRMKCEEEA
jgi:hypothetical protein